MMNSGKFTIFYGIVLFNSVIARDYVLQAFNKHFNHSSDPCNDFYRYFCPIGIGLNLEGQIDKEMNELVDETLKLNFFDTEIKHDIENILENQWNIYSDYSKFKLRIYTTLQDHLKQLCLNKDNSTLFLETLTELSYLPEYYRHLIDLAEDKDCSRVSEKFERSFPNFLPPIDNISKMEFDYLSHQYQTATLLMYSDEKIIGAMYEIRSYLEQMIYIVKEWAKETPWLQNSNTEEAFERIVEDVEFKIEIAKNLRSVLEEFLGVEKRYLKCKNGLAMNNEVEAVLCAHYTLKLTKYVKFDGFVILNAINDHPTINILYPFLYLLNNLNDEASKLGVVGTVLGHELSHTIIKDYGDDGGIYLPYFSDNVRTCIQKQFNSTCEEYSETSKCAAHPQNIDENGADLLGNQLTYELLKNYYGDELHSQHPKIGATYEQIFFFAQGLIFCDGKIIKYDHTDVHSPDNIRVNVIVQLPEFQTAYHCSDNSRMIRSRTEICTILGAAAPPTKRH